MAGFRRRSAAPSISAPRRALRKITGRGRGGGLDTPRRSMANMYGPSTGFRPCESENSGPSPTRNRPGAPRLGEYIDRRFRPMLIFIVSRWGGLRDEQSRGGAGAAAVRVNSKRAGPRHCENIEWALRYTIYRGRSVVTGPDLGALAPIHR